jgi:hypothetical protein
VTLFSNNIGVYFPLMSKTKFHIHTKLQANLSKIHLNGILPSPCWFFQDFSVVSMSGYSRVQTLKEICRVTQCTSTGGPRLIFDSLKNFYYQRLKQKKTKLRGLSPLANYTDRLRDRRLSAKLVPILADTGCRVVSATIPHGR